MVSQEKRASTSADAQELRVSDNLVKFVDIVFGVVVGQGFVRYTSLILNPASDWFSFWALVSVYVVTILSWIGYHRSMIRYPYQTDRMHGWFRVLADFLVVSVYARMLFSVENLQAGARLARLDQYLLCYVLIFLTYLLSGLCRRWETTEKEASHVVGLVAWATIYLAFFLIYRLILVRLGAVIAPGNWLFLLGSGALYVFYRLWRHRK